MKLPIAKYTEFKQNIQDGDLLLCMGETKLSEGIKWTEDKQDKIPMAFQLENGKTLKNFFSHVGVFFRKGRHVFIVEANGKIVDQYRFSRVYHKNKYKGHLFIVRPQYWKIDITFTPEKTIPMAGIELVERCLDYEGSKYDTKAIWQQLINVFRKEAYKHSEDEQLFCSELVNLASNHFWEREENWCTPHDIALKERDNFLVKITDVQ